MIFNNSKFNQNWTTKPLYELGNFNRGKSKHRPRNDNKLFIGGKYPLIQTGEIKESQLYIRKHTKNYNEFGLKQSKLWPTNTLCITIAANIAETALLGYPMCFPDSVVGFNAFEDESSELFMHYIFSYIKKAIQNTAIGSIQDNINIDYLTNLDFKIPTKPYQDKVVKVLSSLDLKIELNDHINTELEQMAKTLYDYWFLQFDFPNEHGKPYKSSGGKMVYNEELKREIPKDWEVKSLSEITPVSNASTNPMFYPNKIFKHYSIPTFDLKKTYELEPGNNIKSNKFVVEELDLLVAKLNPGFNRVVYPSKEEDQICSTEFVVWRTPSVYIKNYLYILSQNKHFIDYCTQSATGTSNSHRRVSPASMLQYKVAYNQELAELYGKKIDSFIKNYISNQKENQLLASLRDWLLPMLMNGQVTVKEAEEKLNMAAEQKDEYNGK